MMKCLSKVIIGTTLAVSAATPAAAQEEAGLFGWIHGDWYLKVGATGMFAPDFEGGKDYLFSVSPIISLGKVGPEARFSSRNDAISFSLYDAGTFRAGVAGKLIFGRDDDDADEVKGLDPVEFGGELGGFAEFYPTDWLRVRGEVRQGIRSHNGVVADLSADAFHDVTDRVRVSAGPRLSLASKDYFDAYYGVNAQESAASGLAEYVRAAASNRSASAAPSTGRLPTALPQTCLPNIRGLWAPRRTPAWFASGAPPTSSRSECQQRIDLISRCSSILLENHKVVV